MEVCRHYTDREGKGATTRRREWSSRHEGGVRSVVFTRRVRTNPRNNIQGLPYRGPGVACNT